MSSDDLVAALLGEVGFMRSCIASGERLSSDDLARQDATMARAVAALAAKPEPGHPDAGNPERNHYDWFMPENVSGHVDSYLDHAAYDAGRAEGMRAVGALPPRGTRLVLMTDELMDILAQPRQGVSTTWIWGEPDEHGWYSPTFTETRLGGPE